MTLNPANGTPGIENAAQSNEQVATDRVSFFKLKTKAIFNRLERIAAEMDSDKLHGMDEYALTALLDSLGELKSSFNGAHTSLEELDFDSICSDLPGKFDSNLVNLRSTLQREIGKRSAPQLCSTFRVNANESQSIIVNTNRSRLPLLTLPKFTGAYTEWTNFFSMFVSVIDKDSDLTPVDKLQHLRSCLSGAALDTIRSLEINEAHIREIFGLGKADGSVGRLRELTDKVTAHIRALQSLGSKEQISDCIIVQLLIQKLDKATQSKWEENSPTNELPSWDQLSTFLEKRCRTLENVEHVMQTPVGQAGKSGKNVSTNQRKSFVASGGSVGGCVFCGSHEHLIYHCPRFTNLSPNLRQKEVKQLALCLNCLKKRSSDARLQIGVLS
ncbi:uncharacterized protein LOC118755383 isoform X1 [Rhagoletis pomonella]|uniref:uncharacterized protein LOC118755383 isoform X1 n=1 Tax=Rhagoletis pomonella TaxID=28610 RepID=UPI001786A57B|nr:uncharacterized protein LOC118755383 isoform X1 [Rhagoletis pomonella]